MTTMGFLVFLLFFFVCFSAETSPSVYSILPPQYSLFFGESAGLEIKMTESFLSGDQIQQKFGISLWVKLPEVASGPIFTIRLPKAEENTMTRGGIFVSLSYLFHVLKLEWLSADSYGFSLLTLPYESSENWIFIGISAGFENKSCLFYYNNLGSEFYTSGFFYVEISIPVNSFLILGKNMYIWGRIGDFRIHNNIYNEVSDWKLQYSSSCAAVSCTSLFPSIDYGKCDQWCASEAERFFPLFEPVLYSNTPYLTIDDKFYTFDTASWIYYDISPSLWNDFSITGWFQFEPCPLGGFTFLMIYSKKLFKVYIELALSSSSSDCDKLEATIYSTDGTNHAYDSVSITSSSYIGNWFFFAITLNSGSKLLTLYSQNGINPPSSLFPLISSSVTYTYAALPFDSTDMDIYIGGFNDTISPGDYADFRFYPSNFIDATLLQYNNNIYSAAIYLDPHCLLWASIWYCDMCEIGYFLKNGICQKCHYSCAACSSGDTESNCLSCANGYFAQPGNPSMCFDYCPLGYAWDYSLNQCKGTPGSIGSLNFDDKLLENFDISALNAKFGNYIDYYPDFDYIDPYPANKRGIYFKEFSYIAIDKTYQSGIFSSDFTIEVWALSFSSEGILFTALKFGAVHSFYDNTVQKNFYLIEFLRIFIEKRALKFSITNKENSSQELVLPSANANTREWELLSFSLSFDHLSKTSKVIISRNRNYYQEIITSYYKEVVNMTYHIGNDIQGGCGFIGYMYSFSMYNYGKSYSEIIAGLGTCTSCSACPGVLNSCLPTCGQDEYVDENGNCQKCLSKCSWTCSRADTCNLCYDDLCYKCTTYEIGACIQCIANAILIDGKCKCQGGYIKQDNECVNKCGDGFYLDFNAQKCLSCSNNCLRCNDGDSCIVCKSSFTNNKGKCACMNGYFFDSSNKCLKCDSSCMTCSGISSNCTSCVPSLPILYGSNKCYPCDSFEGYSNYFAIPVSYFSEDLLSQLAYNCIEICGDGRNMGQAQCDDVNNANGDGCSSSCAVETGWSCFGGSSNSPDVCKDITPPLPILMYLSEESKCYLLSLLFSEPVVFTSEISKNIDIEIESILKFSWSITEKNSLFIITLSMHESVSAGTSVKVIFKNPSSIADFNGNEMKESSVSTNLLESFAYTTGQAIKSSVITATTITAASSVLGSLSAGIFMGSFNFQAFWNMIEIMQIQNYLIFLSPEYPDNLLSYLEALGAANGNFLPNPFQLYLVKSDPFSDPPHKFVEQNFNTDFLMNSGQFILAWAIILAGLPISLFLYKLCPRFSLIKKIKKLYFFSILLRIGIESFLEITLSAFLQLREFSQPSQDIGYLSLTLSVLIIVYLASTFALIIWQVTLKSKETLNMKMHEQHFGTLYEGFKRDSRLKVSFLIFQNSRRVLFVVFCAFLYDYAIIQMALSLILSFTYTSFLILLRPYQNLYLGNGLHISCELFYFISHCLMLKFLDDKISDDYRTNIGWAIISLLSMSLLFHIIAILIVQATNLIRGIKQFKEWFMKNFANKFTKARRRIILSSQISSKPKEDAEEITVNMAYFEGRTPENINDERVYSLGSTDINTKGPFYINTDSQ
ncbi:unnamed protein product [Blepharisma stoltei]|uniref:Uncharacterized protein n=1 Tax=Blepharisma stoltei TaxID=1481888 RepID=A0AAU9JPB0_9CILI|nr:unnamed protein product [Blepharisma stoltei]